MRDADFRHLHWSGRFDASHSEFVHMLNTGLSHKPHVFTGTEAYDDNKQKTLKAVRGWVHGVGNAQHEQCWVLADADVFKRVHFEQRALSGKRWHNSKGHWLQPVTAAILVVEHERTGKRFAFIVAHLASHVQGYDEKGKVSPKVLRGAAWLADVAVLNRVRMRMMRKYKANVVIVADWNLDLRKAWCRVATSAAGGRLVWRRPFPSRGTHGHRLIDGTRISGKRKLFSASSAKVLDTVRGFDHRPYSETVHFKVKPGRRK